MHDQAAFLSDVTASWLNTDSNVKNKAKAY